MKHRVPLAVRNGSAIKVVDFRVINFFDENVKRPDGSIGSEVVLIYALGEDGIIREFSGGQWTPLPVYG